LHDPTNDPEFRFTAGIEPRVDHLVRRSSVQVFAADLGSVRRAERIFVVEAPPITGIASGTLFRVGGKHFIVTAAHVVESFRVDGHQLRIGLLADLASDLDRPEGTKHAVELAEQCLSRQPVPADAALLHYFLANAWSHLRANSRRASDAEWDWEQTELEREILHLRRALVADGYLTLPKVRQCQIATNFGNMLSHVGRFVEAIEYWNRALSIDPEFAMAAANRGHGLVYYARALYDPGHQNAFLRQAHLDLTKGLSLGVDERARPVFEHCKSAIEGRLPDDYLQDGTDMEGFSLGDSEDERRYRRWCLDQGLFLNPLNDLGPFPIAARDVFATPSIVVSIDEGPSYQGFYNQMKQEFVSARYLYYEGIAAKEPHFSDREVLLFNTLDYPSYSLSVEKLKLAFRMAYSLFDKIAYFLNDCLQLSIPERNVTFRTMWYDRQQRERGLKQWFRLYKNWPLRGLFWLSKDLYENEPGFRQSIEPDAQELNEIRNHAEHKYLKLHDMWSPDLRASRKKSGQGDTLAYSVKRSDFEAKALRILKLARAGLVYLSLGVHWEEQRRQAASSTDKIIVPMFLDVWEDEWKR